MSSASKGWEARTLLKSNRCTHSRPMTTPAPFSVYIMELGDGRLYVGQTNQPLRRHQEHRRGHGSRTSRVFGVGTILYAEPHPDRASAVRHEAQIKKWTRAKKQALIDGDMEALHRLAKRRKG